MWFLREETRLAVKEGEDNLSILKVVSMVPQTDTTDTLKMLFGKSIPVAMVVLT